MIKVFISNGLHHSDSYMLDGKTAQIGRGPSNQVRLNEPSVSRKHVKIYRDNGQYFIEDLQSTNGTWINGNVIASGARFQVQEGVPIDVGNVLVSLGKKCPPNRFPNEYSIAIAPPRDGSLKPSTFTDRRAKQKKELELIYDISAELLGSLDLSRVCQNALDSITRLLKGIDRGFVFLMDPDSGKLRMIVSSFREGTTADGLQYSRSLVRRVVKECKAIMILDTTRKNKADLPDNTEKIGTKSVICVPLVSKIGTMGAIYLQSVNTTQGFRKNELFFCNQFEHADRSGNRAHPALYQEQKSGGKT